jgi:P2 family phage contractile tail tube protein
MAISAKTLPEVINNYNVYDDRANRMIGISGEVELPNFEAMTETLSGSGILGEYEDPVTGHYSSMTIKIPFSNLWTNLYDLMNTTRPPQLTLRGSMQVTDTDTNVTDYVPVKIVIRGKCKTTESGKVDAGKKMESSVEMEIAYIRINVAGSDLVELDKLNFKFLLNGVDMMAKIRSQI